MGDNMVILHGEDAAYDDGVKDERNRTLAIITELIKDILAKKSANGLWVLTELRKRVNCGT
jgi:hypothetical protein